MTSFASAPVPAPVPRWLHVCAVLTVLATLPMMVLGAEVTTKGVGMVDRAGLRSPIYMIEALWRAGGVQALIDDKGLGWVIEHSHRTVGFALGLCAIALAVGIWRKERRRWVKVAGILAPFAVLSQGVLGILRIALGRDDPNLGTAVALIHGCTAQLVLGLLVAVALWTSRTWTAALRVPDGEGMPRLRKVSLVLVAMLYAQVVLGAVVRHKEIALGFRAHVLVAFAVTAAVVWLLKLTLETQPLCAASVRAALVLSGLLVVQIVLGLETLLSKLAVQWPYTGERLQPIGLSADLIRSLHFLVGAMTFAAALAVALLAHRHVVWAPGPAPQPVRQLEGAL
jgi:heme a synthase